MVAPFVTPEQNAQGRATGCDNQKRDSQETKLTQLLNMQEIAYEAVMNKRTDISEKAGLIRAYDVLEERIRILRNKVKPGSRNVSVRELSAAEQQKRIGPRASRPTDYLKDAEATLARAQAMSEPTAPPDSQAK